MRLRRPGLRLRLRRSLWLLRPGILIAALARGQARLWLGRWSSLGRRVVRSAAAITAVTVAVPPVITAPAGTAPIPVSPVMIAPVTIPVAMTVVSALVVIIAAIIVIGAGIAEIEIVAAGRPPRAVASVPRPGGRIIRTAVSRASIRIAVIGARETLVRIDLAVPVTERVSAFRLGHILAIAVAGAGLRVAG